MRYFTIFLLLIGIQAFGQDTTNLDALRFSVVQVLGTGRGSGFVSGKIRDSVYIVTAKHVISNAQNVLVNLEGLSDVLPAKILFVADGELDDIALLAVCAPKFEFKPLDVNESLEPSSELFVIRSAQPKVLLPEFGKATLLKSNPEIYRYILDADGIKEGDSGGAVFVAGSAQLVGVVLGGAKSLVEVMQITRVKMLLESRFIDMWQLK